MAKRLPLYELLACKLRCPGWLFLDFFMWCQHILINSLPAFISKVLLVDAGGLV